jgi:ComF family protein
VNLASWAEDLLDLFLPAGCVACRAWIPAGRPTPLVCVGCRSRLREAPWPRCPRCHHPRGTGRVDAPDCLECRSWDAALDAARYAFVLEPPADDLVHALKYEGWPELAELMGAAMARLPLTGEDDPRPRVVVPVPTTAERLRKRGYNQAELLARRLARGVGAPMCAALRRTGGRPSQTSLAPDERRENVRGVFSPAPGGAAGVAGKQVLLVDDVLTTGATASEAARTLVVVGARSVVLVAFARALPTRSGKRA